MSVIPMACPSCHVNVLDLATHVQLAHGGMHPMAINDPNNPTDPAAVPPTSIDPVAPAPADLTAGAPAPADVTTTAPADVTTTAPADVTTTAPADVTTTAPAAAPAAAGAGIDMGALADQLKALGQVPGVVDALRAEGVELGGVQTQEQNQLDQLRQENAAKMDTCENCGASDGLRVQVSGVDPNKIEYLCLNCGAAGQTPSSAQQTGA